ncbi:hypothetical protein V6N11_065026 [Hibiscus sabdariffa]|uniref:Uncharacterized protein n=1 Tax=Hibiscus sabdariffa TaxID=183260 RepID=A0ABR2SJN2_9ROSI
MFLCSIGRSLHSRPSVDEMSGMRTVWNLRNLKSDWSVETLRREGLMRETNSCLKILELEYFIGSRISEEKL